MKFHHVGLITPEVVQSVEFYLSLGYEASPIYEDPVQRARIVLLDQPGHPTLELVSPLDEKSPAHKWLERLQIGPYHLCYEVPSLDEAVAKLRKEFLMPVFGPSPAVAFQGRQVLFLWGKRSGLIELLHTPGLSPEK